MIAIISKLSKSKFVRRVDKGRALRSTWRYSEKQSLRTGRNEREGLRYPSDAPKYLPGTITVAKGLSVGTLHVIIAAPVNSFLRFSVVRMFPSCSSQP